MLVSHNYPFPSIIKLNMHVISQYLGEFVIASTL